MNVWKKNNLFNIIYNVRIKVYCIEWNYGEHLKEKESHNIYSTVKSTKTMLMNGISLNVWKNQYL